MPIRGNRPLIGVISDRRMQGQHPFHMVGEKYLQAVANGGDAYPVALPCLTEGFDVLDIVDRLDGIFLTGSPSNLEPHHYMGSPSEAGTWLHEVPGYRVHKEDPDEPLDIQYGPSHTVKFTQGGLLENITGVSGATVNSLHSQGVDQLGAELEVEAVAEDGLVEGFTVKNTPGFTLAVQWHPEWKVLDNPVSSAIFRAYGDACRAYRLREWRR
jgi:putative glutamine amidotransferase